jgi:hypothetical protein
MNDRDQRHYHALKRAQTFGAEQSADFASDSEASTRLNNIETVLRKIDEAKAGQAAGSGNASKVALIDALRIVSHVCLAPQKQDYATEVSEWTR